MIRGRSDPADIPETRKRNSESDCNMQFQESTIIPAGFDASLALGSDEILEGTVPHSHGHWESGIVIPEREAEASSVQEAVLRIFKILTKAPSHARYRPHASIRITEESEAREIAKLVNSGESVLAGHLDPSDFPSGIESTPAYAVLEAMERYDVPLLLDCRDASPGLREEDREKTFVNGGLASLVRVFPRLRIVLRGITTKMAADFVLDAPDEVAATITPHHLLFGRMALLDGPVSVAGFVPVMKTSVDQLALIRAATSGNPKFFAGTSSGSDPLDTRGLGSPYHGTSAMAAYAEAFDRAQVLGEGREGPTSERFAAFVSKSATAYFRLEWSPDPVRLTKAPTTVPETYALGNGHEAVPFHSGKTFGWKAERVVPEDGIQ